MADSGAIRAGRSYVELFTDDVNLVKGLNNAQKKLQAWGKSVTAAGLKAIAAGTALAAPLLASTKQFAEMGTELARASQKTGVAVEQLSALKYAAEKSGVGFERLQGGLAKMAKAVYDAASGSPQATQALRSLGLSVADLSKLKPDEQFVAISEAISKVQNPTERTALAMKIFGKSGADLLPLMQQGAAGINAMIARADELGLVMSTDDANAALEFTEQLDDLWAVVKMGAAQVGGALVPALRSVVKAVTDGVMVTRRFINEHRGLVVAVAGAAAGLIGFGAALVGGGYALRLMAPLLRFASLGVGTLGSALRMGVSSFKLFGTALGSILPLLRAVGSAALFVLNPLKLVSLVASGITAAFGGLATAIGVLLSPTLLVGAAVIGLAGYFLYTSGVVGRAWNQITAATSAGAKRSASLLGSLASYLRDIFNAIKTDVLSAFGGIKDAMAAGDWSLAAKILWTLIKTEFARGETTVLSFWAEFKAALLDAWANLSAGIATAWSYVVEYLSNWDGVKAAAQKLLTWLGGAFENTVNRVADLLQDLFMTTGKKQLKIELAKIDADEKAGKYKNGPYTAQQAREQAIRTYGDYDDKQRADRDRRRQQDYADRQKQIDEDYARKQPGAVAGAEATRAKIEAERRARLAQDKSDLEKRLAEAQAKGEKDVAALKQQLADLNKQAAQEAKKNGPELKKPAFDKDGAAAGIDAAMKASVSGTFSAAAVSGMGESRANRQRDEMIKKLAEIKQVIAAVQDSGLAYG